MSSPQSSALTDLLGFATVTFWDRFSREIVERTGATPRVVEVLDVVDDGDRVIDFRGPAFALTFWRGPWPTISLTQSSVLVAPAHYMGSR
jgi:hypothetical protein